MTGQRKTIRGSVAILTCQTCAARLPLFEFEVESDTDTIGFCSAAKCNSLEIVIAEVTFEEWTAMQDGSLSSLPSRLNGFENFHVMHIKRIERIPDPPAGTSFSEFRKLYAPPLVVYDCPCCADGEAIKTLEATISEFEEMGGRVISLDGIIVEH